MDAGNSDGATYRRESMKREVWDFFKHSFGGVCHLAAVLIEIFGMM